MSLILLGILNSQVSGAGAGAYDLLETQVLGTAAASVTFTGLGSYSDYKHLQIRAVARTDGAGVNDFILMKFNGTGTGTNRYHLLYGNGTSVISTNNTTGSGLVLTGWATANGASSDIFGASVIDILDFSSSSKNTTIRSLSGENTSVLLTSGLWIDTSAITSIELDKLASNFVAGSRFSLYGIKGA